MSNTHHVYSHGKFIEVETLDTDCVVIKPRRTTQKRFVKLPLIWANKLAKIGASGSTYRVAIRLLEQAWWTRRATVKLTNTGLVNVSRPAKRVALCKLETAGLVIVERRPNKSPIVTVLQTD